VGCAARSRQGSLEWVSEQRAHSIGLAAAAVLVAPLVRVLSSAISHFILRGKDTHGTHKPELGTRGMRGSKPGRGRARWLPRYRCLVGPVSVWSAVELVCRCSNGRSAPKTVTFGDSCGTILVVSISTSRLRPNLSPRRGSPVSSGSMAPTTVRRSGRSFLSRAVLVPTW
jgi:hypothetical protein